MKKQFLFAIALFLFAVVVFSNPSLASMSLYDDFSQFDIDPKKWNSWENINEVQSGKLLSESVGYGMRGKNNLNFKHPTPVNYIEADVTIKKIAGDLNSSGAINYSFPCARITGYFYNDGSASGPGSSKGEVQAAIRIGSFNGKLWCYWSVWKATDDAGTDWLTLASNYFSTPVSLNTSYKLSLQYAVEGNWYRCSLCGDRNRPLRKDLGHV